ncbi:hypothetical protein [Candidatus Palauibacter sp.]|uniref:hypothetical protein n=1 Tax=Candidatus Palauibacter sp. TaxID=3101350 RepID=UPI003CC61AD2
MSNFWGSLQDLSASAQLFGGEDGEQVHAITWKPISHAALAPYLRDARRDGERPRQRRQGDLDQPHAG